MGIVAGADEDIGDLEAEVDVPEADDGGNPDGHPTGERRDDGSATLNHRAPERNYERY